MWPTSVRRKIHDLQERRKVVREARSRIGELVGDDAVLEVGCGFGPNAGYCRGAYLGLDISGEAVREAAGRHPSRRFVQGNAESEAGLAEGYTAVLFCAVLHEIPDYAAMLQAFGRTKVRRILVCDYDPDLRGWLRVWMSLFEPEARRWWGCHPDRLLPETEWAVTSGHVSRSVLWWEFTRRA